LGDGYDFKELRENFLATNERDESWPEGVKAISLDGLGLLGVNPKTGALYWDGREIVLRRVVRLGNLEKVLAVVGVATGVGALILELGKTFGGWAFKSVSARSAKAQVSPLAQ
jgi:hypothetical protein